MTRTEEEKIKDKLLLLYILHDCKEKGIEMDEDKLMSIIFITQKYLEANNMEGFHYDDWEWKDEEDGE